MLLILGSLAALQDIPPIVRTYPATAVSDNQFCKTMHDIVDTAMTELPKMVDAITRTDGMSVLCGLRTVTTNKTFLVNLSQFREGWQARKQEQWNRMSCDNSSFGPMARKGWRFTLRITFASGEQFILDAKC
jgi:hypothetical protein